MEKVWNRLGTRQTRSREERSLISSPGSGVLAGLLALLVAALVALVIYKVQLSFPDQSEKAVLSVGMVLAALVVLPAAGYLLLRRRAANVTTLSILFLSIIAILLVGIYLYRTSLLVAFPADVLTWSESDFVNDILKFRIGYPIFSAQANNDSFVYPPGPQILTYFLARLAGSQNSIPVYRAIQVLFVLLAVVLAYFATNKLMALGWPEKEKPFFPAYWGVVWMPVLFLIATNSLTNPYVHNLHDDALALLVSSLAYLLLIQYVERRSVVSLSLMALVPAVGLWVKQSLVIWAAFFCIYLLLFDRPRSLLRIVLFGFATAAAVGLSFGIGYLLWKDLFVYWVFTVLGAHGVSPLRSFQHLLDVWPYLAVGLFGGSVLLQGKRFSLLLGPWLIWLALILIQIYTSGVAWMINHIGPGSLIAGIWFLAALGTLWPAFQRSVSKLPALQGWLRVGITTVVLFLLFQGLGVFRIPVQPISKDAYRYIAQIEQEFNGFPSDKVLLDAGTWVYMPDKVIMKDRAPTIGERGHSQTGDFSAIISRIRNHTYSKILVRNLDQPSFWYDYAAWDTSSGIRKALEDSYYVARKIPAVEGADWYLFQDISVLLPKSNGANP